MVVEWAYIVIIAIMVLQNGIDDSHLKMMLFISAWVHFRLICNDVLDDGTDGEFMVFWMNSKEQAKKEEKSDFRCRCAINKPR